VSKSPDLNRPTIEFDVSSEMSLDELSKELLALLLDTERSTLLLNPRGPGGGNTQVLVYTTSERDLAAVQGYVKQHGLSA
jgi:hypothetical protein